MKKVIMLLLLGAAFSTAAVAQSKDTKEDKAVLKSTIKDKKEDKKETRKDLGHLKVKSAVNDNKEVGQHRRSIRHQGKHLRKHGVKNPIHKAKKELREEKKSTN